MSRVDEGAAPLFAAMGDPTRLNLVRRMGSGKPHSITELTKGLSLTRQGVTKHLQVLENAGVVRSERVGRTKQFTYVPDSIQPLQTYLDTVSAQWDEALSRLKAHVES
ncbi:MAG: metalloregulator ArsR/SmtB family transcription factor [Verrucomicrobiota bacterium]